MIMKAAVSCFFSPKLSGKSFYASQHVIIFLKSVTSKLIHYGM
mgnify:CR=1 FL=1